MNYIYRTIFSLMLISITGSLHGVVLADVAIVTSPQSPIASVTPAELEKLFLAKSSTLAGVKAVPVEQSNKSLKAEFHSKVTQKSPDVLQRYWARKVFSGDGIPPAELATDQDVKTWVNNTPGGIGYIDLKSVDASVKVLVKLQ